jgi:membrane protein required for colicin V production
MTVFDYVVLTIVVLSAVLGAWRGLVGEALSLVAWVIALMAAWLFGAQVGSTIFAAIGESALRTVAGAATVILLVLVVVALIKLALRGLLKALGLSLTDRLLGVLFGMLRGLAIVLLLVAVGGLTGAPRQVWWKEARLAPPLETAVLAAKPMLPGDIAKRIRF